MTEDQYNQSIIDKVRTNIIFLNAMECINPTIDFKIKLAETILEMLNNSENLLPHSIATENVWQAEKIGNLFPVLYLSISKS